MRSSNGLIRGNYHISYKKCNVLCLDNTKNKTNMSMITGRENIPQVHQVKDVGVIIDSESKFDQRFGLTNILIKMSRVLNGSKFNP